MADGPDSAPPPPSAPPPLITVFDLPDVTPAGRTLKEWLQEQFQEPLEEEDVRLHNAAYVGDEDTLRALLLDDDMRRRIDDKAVWCGGCLPCTPLRIAATAGRAACLALLIARGAQVDLVDVKGQTALYVAVVNGHLDCVRRLLQAGADPNGSHHHRSSPVYHAARAGREDILLELIRFRADVDLDHQLAPGLLLGARPLTTLAASPLYVSAAGRHLACFRLLLQAGSQPDYNSTGPVCRGALARGPDACLLGAVLRHGCPAPFVHLLLDHGADPALLPWDGPAGRGAVDPEALAVYQEARRCPPCLTHLCRIMVRRALGKRRLNHITSLPLPDPVKNFLLHRTRPPSPSEIH